MTAASGQEEFRALRGNEPQELVTGEAVLLDIPAASLPQRLASGIIDLLIGYIGLGLTVYLVSKSNIEISEPNVLSLTLVITIFWYVALPVAIETATRGRSVGHLVLRQRTVRDDGGPIVFRHALVRGLVGYVEIYALFGIPALFAAMSTARSRRFGDLAAGTYVVREATHIRLQAPAQMPYGLASWAGQADISPLPDGLALAIRQTLERQQALSPAARDQMTHDLLSRVLPLVSPQPPVGTPAVMVLAAVLAERRRRDEQRLRAEADVRHRFMPLDRL